MTPLATERPVRHRLRVTGVVQGVGFRPHVYRLATDLGLSGFVGNDSEGVFAELEGPAGAVERFEARLVTEAPPLAEVEQVEALPVGVRSEPGFRIVASRRARRSATLLPPDVAVCDDCLAELFDPGDRRYRYPFINCTNCGPRFTITLRLPYDRPHTTMAGFSLCAACAAQYADPADRRFHAQPLACPACGPRLWFEGPDGSVVEGTDPALAAAQEALTAGAIVAVKGVGGYHLACDATDPRAVEQLRERKHRPHKPLAVMVPDRATAGALGDVDDTAAALLTSPQRPIVLVGWRARDRLADAVAPGSPLLGLLLPYSPLHHLLFAPVPGRPAPVPGPLVMTSGNLADEPICFDDVEARARLGAIADAWLVHDRPIHMPCDDSVVRIDRGRELPIRRARGFAPLPVRLPFASDDLLATGGELKNTFCLASGRHAWVSQHLGDMGSLETLTAFERSVRLFTECYEVSPEAWAADAHPGYQVRRWAEEHAVGPGGVGPAPPRPRRLGDGRARRASRPSRSSASPSTAPATVPTGPSGGARFSWRPTPRLRAGRPSSLRAAAGRGRRRTPARTGRPWPTCGRPGSRGTTTWPRSAPLPPRARTVLARQLERTTLSRAHLVVGRLFDAVSSLVGLRQDVSLRGPGGHRARERPRPPSTVTGATTGSAPTTARSTPARAGGPRRGPPGRPAGGGDGPRVPRAVAEHDRRGGRTGASGDGDRPGGPQRGRVPERRSWSIWPRPARRPRLRGAHPPHRPRQRRGTGPRAGRGGRLPMPAGGPTVTAVAGGPGTAGTRDAAEDLAAAAFDLARRFAAGATLWCVAPRAGPPTPTTWPWSSSIR